ncbi:MAG: N-acetyltransferase family protein [Allosphingosinicella sp.]
MRIRLATAPDAAAIASIYAPYVTGTTVSFETAPPSVEDMGARIAAGGDLYPWFVACDEDDRILGYASASAFRARHAYRFSVETSVYVAQDAHHRGVGGRLYRRLLGTLEAQGFTQAIGAITLPNPASVALHEKLGFRQAGVYRDVGHKLGQWLSVGLWQRPLAPLSPEPGEPRLFASFVTVGPET